MQLITPALTAVKTAIGTTAGALQVGGTILSTAGAVKAGSDANSVAKWQAAQMEEQAKAEQAAASQEAENRRKDADLILSRARAVGAASGGGIDYNLMGDLEEEGAYRVGLAIAEGDERAKGRRLDAAATRAEGRMQKSAAFLKGGRTILGGTASLMEKYG